MIKAPHQQLSGILCVAFAVSLFSLQDVALKFLSGAYSLTLLISLRSCAAILVLLPFAWWQKGLAGLRPRQVHLLLTRSALMLISLTFYCLGLALLKLGDAVAIAMSSPIWLTLFGAIFLRERVSWSQWLITLAGFVGVLLVAWPGEGVFKVGALFSLSAAMSYAAGQVLARKTGVQNSTLVMVLYQNAIYLSVSVTVGLFFSYSGYAALPESVAFLTRPWGWLQSFDAAVFVLASAIYIVATNALTHGYRITEASVVAPFEYIAPAWAVLWGYVFWSEVQSVSALIGTLVIVLAGLLLLRQGRRSQIASGAPHP